MEIKIKYQEGMKPIYRVRDGEWFDLRAGEDKEYTKGDIVTISLGVSMELPLGYEALILPRSSVCRKRGLVWADSGLIDHAFCGDNDVWGATFYAVRSGKIFKNDRICQFRILPVQKYAEVVEVRFLGNEDRGGYGSTGTK